VRAVVELLRGGLAVGLDPEYPGALGPGAPSDGPARVAPKGRSEEKGQSSRLPAMIRMQAPYISWCPSFRIATAMPAIVRKNSLCETILHYILV